VYLSVRARHLLTNTVVHLCHVGLDAIHALTDSMSAMLRVHVWYSDGSTQQVKYGVFHVGPATDGYVLTVGTYTYATTNGDSSWGKGNI
jgi:hypothetical protein